MLSFEVTKSGKAIQICCDTAGLALLLEKLVGLIRQPDEAYLRGPSAGGQDLSEMSPFGGKAAGEVIIDYQPLTLDASALLR